jgi:CspA family cold shock protein
MMGQIQELEIGKRAFDAVLQGSDRLAEAAPVEAAVKWFNASKGYGFVELSGGGGDAFLHLKALREIGRQTLPSGAKMRVVARTGARGAEVLRIVEVDTRTAVDRSPRRSVVDPSSAVELTGKVKWFDDVRGFGFVASDDFGRDIFVHSTTLAGSGVNGLSEGQAVSMRVVETPKGREAIAIVI